MQAADVRNGPNAANFRWLNFPPLRHVHVQALMDAISSVVLKVVLEDSAEVGLAEYDYVIKAFSPDAAV